MDKIMKYPRIADPAMSGCGLTLYENDWFRVIKWNWIGSQTVNAYYEMDCKLHPALRMYFDDLWVFDGLTNEHIAERCFEQLTFREVMEVVGYQKGQSFAAGQKSKVDELREVLGFKKYN